MVAYETKNVSLGRTSLVVAAGDGPADEAEREPPLSSVRSRVTT